MQYLDLGYPDCLLSSLLYVHVSILYNNVQALWLLEKEYNEI